MIDLHAERFGGESFTEKGDGCGKGESAGGQSGCFAEGFEDGSSLVDVLSDVEGVWTVRGVVILDCILREGSVEIRSKQRETD